MRTITITAYRRPHLLCRTLQSLIANDLEGWHILIAIEPSAMAGSMAGMARQILSECDFTVAINETVLGIADNPYRLIERAFSHGSELNLYLEEDMLVAPDTTQLALWYQANHRSDWLCLNLIAGGCSSTGLISNPDYPDTLFAGHTFNSLGFAIRRAEWEGLMREAWKNQAKPIVQFDGAPTGGWDWAVSEMLMKSEELRTLQPVLARATHTGRHGGEFCPPWFHDAAFADLPLSARPAASMSYRLVEVDQLPSVVRRHVLLWFEMTRAWRALTER